jgi:linoleoyl-CoA desaturase
MDLPTVRFSRDTTAFTKTLRQRVANYFEENGISQKGDYRIYVKTTLMIALYFTPWALFTFGLIGGGWSFWIAEIVMGLGLAGIGLNVMHDANHGSFSKHDWVNNVVGRVLDMVGGNSRLWRIQHNVLHHSYTNIDGLDEDIAPPSPIMRFSPNSEHKSWHKFQYIYAWGMYALMSLWWMVAKDWVAVKKYDDKGLITRSGTTKGKLAFYMLWTKALHFGYILVLPMMISGLPWHQILLGWVVMHLVAGFGLAAIFQPAHVLEDHNFVQAEKGAIMKHDVLTHQLNTTANFATRSRLFTWICGGLNHQIEHHLFPSVCHIHFPDLAPIVKKTAEEFSLPYRSATTYWQALKLHTQMLRSLGRA